ASSFGVKSPTLNSDWIFVNGLAGVGYTATNDIVNGAGTAGDQIWKWINLSQFTGNSDFTVGAGDLTQTFQIGARENGLDMDKFVFGSAGTEFTVADLDSGILHNPVINTNTFPGPDGIAFHRFSAMSNGLNLDGANPAAGLTLINGVLCGTTLNGGTQGNGVAFYMSLDGTNFSAFQSFAGAPESANPKSDLMISDAGFFGASLAGGNNDVGAVFSGNTNGDFSILQNFSAVSADNATNFGGASPGELILSGNTLFGTTTAGGVSGNGTIFSLSTNGAGFAVLHDFSALDCNSGTNADGAFACGNLIILDKTIYGTASSGGNGGAGVIFSLGTNGTDFTILHSFESLDADFATNSDGAFPVGGLVLSDGTLYGTTMAGGAGGEGVIFSVGTNGLGFSVLHHFAAIDSVTGKNSDGASPCAALTLSGGYLFGTTAAGGANSSGTVFCVSTNGLKFQTIHAFAALDFPSGTNRDGAFPVAGVLPIGSSLYGTTFSGGPGGVGTVFNVPVPPLPAFITKIGYENGNVKLRFLGTPKSTNIVQATSDLALPVLWHTISTNVADDTGAWQFMENSTDLTRFYRSYAP
ncbi:MAG TPA: choice-of-anchor tandem repeat GloVer-containing protein, partial [Verrucomicrobiae bacterium]|nr:choice-of-anchor tandem repeat GloVer-containing protein [Verrucomicrobiae bacterium]